jgi:hypothetical protein
MGNAGCYGMFLMTVADGLTPKKKDVVRPSAAPVRNRVERFVASDP